MPDLRVLPQEAARLTLLQAYPSLDTPTGSSLEHVIKRTASLFAAPMAALCLRDRERFRPKLSHGMPVRDLAHAAALCTATLGDDELLVIQDASQDRRTAGNPLVLGPERIRFFAGIALTSAQGRRLGAICILGRQPHEPSFAQLEALLRLAREAVTRLQARVALADMARRLMLDRAH